jgi:hypothetical protein
MYELTDFRQLCKQYIDVLSKFAYHLVGNPRAVRSAYPIHGNINTDIGLHR